MIYVSQNTTLDINISLSSGQPYHINEEEIREVHFSVSMTYFILGVVSNVVTLAIVKLYHNDTEYHNDTILTMNLFVNNFLASFFVTLSMALNAKFLYPSKGDNSLYITFCKLQLYLEYSIFGAEYLILILIGISRYLMINRYALYQRIFNNQWYYRFILIFCWAVSPVAFLYTIFLPWDDLKYSVYTSTCCYKGKGQDGFYFSTATFLFTIPIMLFTYIAISIKLFKVNINLRNIRRKSVDFDKKDSSLREKWFVMTIIVLFFKIFVTYLPHTLLTFVDLAQIGQSNSMEKHLTFFYLRLSNTFTNAISYCFLNSIVRSTIIKLWPFCQGKVHSSASSIAECPEENISLPDIKEEADNEGTTSTDSIKQKNPEQTIITKMPLCEENMQMSFSSNSIYIISTNSMDQSSCEEMLSVTPQALTSRSTSISAMPDNQQDILPHVHSTV